MEQKIVKLIAEKLNKKVEEIKMESRLVEDLGADSLDVVELVMSFEDEFGIALPDEDVANLKTIKVDKENLHFSSKDGVLFNKSGTQLILYPNNRKNKKHGNGFYVNAKGEMYAGIWKKGRLLRKTKRELTEEEKDKITSYMGTINHMM